MTMMRGYFGVNFTRVLSVSWMCIVINRVSVSVDWGLSVEVGIVLICCV